jgi:hypothetical protein
MTERIDNLDELLNDPLVQMVMRRDNVRPEDLRRSLERARRVSRSPLPPHLFAEACRHSGLCAS